MEKPKTELILLPPLQGSTAARTADGAMDLLFDFPDGDESDWGKYLLLIGGPRASHYRDQTTPQEYEQEGEGPVISKRANRLEWPSPSDAAGIIRVCFSLTKEQVCFMTGREMGFNLTSIHVPSGERKVLTNGLIFVEADSVTIVGGCA